MKINNFKDLNIWKKGIELVDMIYDITAKFPREEIYGLTNQLRRCSVSVPSNIAEGSARNGTEIETQLFIARRRKFIEEPEFNKLSIEIKEIDKMIFGLMNSLRKKI